MEGSPYRKFSIFRRKGWSLRPVLECFLAGTWSVPLRGPGASSSGDPEADVLPGVWRNSIPELRFRFTFDCIFTSVFDLFKIRVLIYLGLGLDLNIDLALGFDSVYDIDFHFIKGCGVA